MSKRENKKVNNRRIRSLLPPDLKKEYRDAKRREERMQKHAKKRVEKISKEAIKNVQPRENREKFIEYVQPTRITIDHETAKEKAREKANQKQKHNLILQLREYCKRNNIDEMTLMTQQEGDKIKLRWANESGEIMMIEVLIAELEKIELGSRTKDGE